MQKLSIKSLSVQKRIFKRYINMLGYLLSTLLKDPMDMQAKHDKKQTFALNQILGLSKWCLTFYL